MKDLVEEQAQVAIYDPQVTKAQIWEELQIAGCQDFENYVTVCTTPYDAAEDAHAVVILTEWDVFSNKEKTSAKQESRSAEAEDSAVEVTNSSRSVQSGLKVNRPSVSIDAERVEWSRVFGLMQKPAFVFDGRRVVDVEKLEKLGFHVESIGKGNIA